MNAIRCKSSSQVSSQVMIRLGLMLVFLLVVAAPKKSDHPQRKKNGAAFQIFHGEIEKYELCVKLVMVCRKLKDRAPDYTDFEEEANGELNAEDEAEYRESNCVPTGLSSDGEKYFWHIVAQWQKEIDDRFLIQNLFVVIKTTDNGRNTKLAFGKWQGWCNRTDFPDDLTETPEEEDRSVTVSPNPPTLSGTLPPSIECDGNSQHGKWIFNEVKETRNLGKVVRGFSNFLLSLEKYARTKCCPYRTVRDRLEIIHDGIDFLQNLQGKESSTNIDYTDINSDIFNLRSRLEQFNYETYRDGGANYSSGRCCPNILDELNSFKSDFVRNLKSIGPQKPNIDYNPFMEKEKRLQDMYFNQLGVTRVLENSMRNLSSKDTCCDEGKSKINHIEQFLNDLKRDHSLEELSKLIDPLKESLAYTKESLSGTERLLVFEDGNIQKLTLLCGKECRQDDPKLASLQGLIFNVDKLENKINNMSKLGSINVLQSVNLLNIKQSIDIVNDMVKDSSPVYANITIIKKKLRKIRFRNIPKNLDHSSSRRCCLKDLVELSNLLENINKAQNDTSFYHEVQENMVKQQFQEIVDKQNDLEGSDPNPPNDLQLMIDQLERDLDNLTENGINKLDREMQYDQIKFEIEKEKFDRDVQEQLKNINLFGEEMKKEQSLIEDRIAKFKAKMLEAPKAYEEKLSKLEAIALEFPEQIKSYEKDLESRIDILQQQLKDLDKEIENTEHRADICDGECDFGDLDSVDELIERVQAIKDKLSPKSTPVKKKIIFQDFNKNWIKKFE
ncbi:uncharacterized protein LOC108038940 [Drosophila rhopaloa]|uniref:Uncharacterized protein n=1 Tax=Drosophila rhopaloa TaxID=1041015 RepID=A0ABM5JFH0_DRORH|nr:uncharacterized protein LOC108038940 [Drosophila rhopaloa]